MSTFFLVYIIINNNERWGEEEEDIEWCDSVKTEEDCVILQHFIYWLELSGDCVCAGPKIINLLRQAMNFLPELSFST